MSVARKICIAGVGPVGAILAARLISAGESVALFARGSRLEELRRDGLRVDFADQSLHYRVTVSDRAEFGVQDIVFLAVKAHGLSHLLASISSLIAPHTTVVPLVNGIPWWYFQHEGSRFEGQTVRAVDPNGYLSRAISAERIVAGVLYLTARRADSGAIVAPGRQRIALGALCDSARSNADEVAQLLSRAGIASQAQTHIRNELWTKVALNLATNPLSVVTETSLIEQFTDCRLLPLVIAVIEETLQVAVALGAAPSMTLEQMIATGRQAGPFETSMLQDYRAKRPLELGAIAYAVLELAAKGGVKMPISGHIVNLCARRADVSTPLLNQEKSNAL